MDFIKTEFPVNLVNFLVVPKTDLFKFYIPRKLNSLIFYAYRIGPDEITAVTVFKIHFFHK